jgi:hypothetical protein
MLMEETASGEGIGMSAALDEDREGLGVELEALRVQEAHRLFQELQRMLGSVRQELMFLDTFLGNLAAEKP